MRAWFVAVVSLVLALFAPAARVASAQPAADTSPAWCAAELEALPGDVCHHAPSVERGASTLVIFLHGVIEPDREWQWAQQRGIVRAANAHGFTTLMPRGRRGIGPKGMQDWWTWPTSAAAQQAVEADVIEEWRAARALLEKRRGRPFERVYVFGFSNGAYYATSLAMRGRFPEANGYAVFAGGSGKKYLEAAGAQNKHRAPIFVGYGEKDRDRKDPKALIAMLGKMRWKHRASGKKGLGHAIADAQMAEAMTFLGAP
jgi:predicted esterase